MQLAILYELISNYMNSTENLAFLKKCFRFTIDVMDFYDELVDQKKAPIAKRILFSTLNGICSLQKAFESSKPGEKSENLKNAVLNFKNVIYWLEQCEKSRYLFNEKLLKKAHDVYSKCLAFEA